MPQRYLEAGDPYHCQCQKTARLLRETLGWPERALAHDLPVALRQRAVAAALHHRGGRAAGKVGRQAARHRRPGLLRRLPGDAGGARHGEPRRLPGQRRRAFAYVPCLNDGELGMRVIEAVVRRELMGWV